MANAIEIRGIKHAQAAAKWALQPYSGNPDINNFEALERNVRRNMTTGHKTTIMRNQVQTGFNNNYWPALSRWLIMKNPALIKVIHPRKTNDLDDEAGRINMCTLYQSITNEEPKIRSWQAAKEVYS